MRESLTPELKQNVQFAIRLVAACYSSTVPLTAHQQIETHHTLGKIVLKIAEEKK